MEINRAVSEARTAPGNSASPVVTSGRTIWITGLSAAGKTTVARQLVEELGARGISNVVYLDGDALREVMGAASGSGAEHDRERRAELALRYSRLCQLLSSQGLIVVIATISLFREVHDWNRLNLASYFEVYLKVPLSELRLRDPKGIYRGHALGNVANVAGVDFHIDEPQKPDLLVEFQPGQQPMDTVNAILERILI